MTLFTGHGVDKDKEEGIKWLTVAAEQGHVDAMKELSEEYASGTLSGEEHQEDAVKWHLASAEQGDEWAQIELGHCYRRGKGVEKNLEEAARWFTEAAEQGNAFGLVDLGVCYQHGQGVEKDSNEAFKCYQESLKTGDDPRAISLVGHSYLEGVGTEIDTEKALGFLREYAENGGDGSGRAQEELGWCHYTDEYGVQDLEEAAKWFRLSAEQGNDMGQYFLAECYRDGKGVEKDFDEALKWFKAAADQGDDMAAFEIAWGNRDWGDSSVEMIKDSIDWIRSGVEQGSSEAMYALSMCYEAGDGVEESEEKREKWLFAAAKLGHREAQYFFAIAVIERLNDEGGSFEEKHEEAVRYIRNLAEEGDKSAQCTLGEWCRDGLVVEKDPKEAFKWFRAAAEQGHWMATGSLGACYRDGIGVEKDSEEADKWLALFNQAFEQDTGEEDD
jgi:hypothetical protein